MDIEVSGISNYVKDNIESIKNSIISSVYYNFSSNNTDISFSNLLNSTIQDIKSSFSINSHEPSFANNSNNFSNTETFNTLQSYVNTLPITNNIAINRYNENISKSNANTPRVKTISDDEFYNNQTLTPEQIDNILKELNSPYANRIYSKGRTVGQLIFDICSNAGTEKTGPKTINPALILAIMGAESNFGKDPQNAVDNPFNIRLQGRFDLVNNFEDSLRIAVNTMYNWAQHRPSDSEVSLFDFAGSKYCEDYEKEWKPNVQKFYSQFMSLSNS